MSIRRAERRIESLWQGCSLPVTQEVRLTPDREHELRLNPPPKLKRTGCCCCGKICVWAALLLSAASFGAVVGAALLVEEERMFAPVPPPPPPPFPSPAPALPALLRRFAKLQAAADGEKRALEQAFPLWHSEAGGRIDVNAALHDVALALALLAARDAPGRGG